MLSMAIYLRPVERHKSLLGITEWRDWTRYGFEVGTVMGVLSYVIFQQGEEIKNQGFSSFLKQLVCCVKCNTLLYFEVVELSWLSWSLCFLYLCRYMLLTKPYFWCRICWFWLVFHSDLLEMLLQKKQFWYLLFQDPGFFLCSLLGNFLNIDLFINVNITQLLPICII